MDENEISFQIRKAIYEVYNETGPGLLESVYEFALKYELECAGLNVKSQVVLPVHYKGSTLSTNYRIDLLVEDKVLVELKSVEELNSVHHKQVITYLKLSKLKLGILVNFNTDYLNSNIIRKVNKL
jgi:GxxExxY protein